jgi:hydrogenase expression/formation protein HypC
MCLGIPMKVVELADGSAVVELSGTRRVISTALLDEVRTGDYVIVHAGFAIQVLNETEAEETLSLIRELVGEDER